MKPILSTILLSTLLLSSGCRSILGRDDDWYSGPGQYKAMVQDAVNTALAELPREIGPLNWDWNGKYRVRIKIVAPAGHIGGIPYFISPNGNRAFGYSDGYQIILPDGFTIGTLRHECGHNVMAQNGFLLGTQHETAHGYFRRHRGKH